MMNLLVVILYLSTIWVAAGTDSLHLTRFGQKHQLLFGVRAGATEKNNNDYDVAEQAIFHGIEQVEAKVQKAVEEEVHSIFHDMDEEKKAQVVDHAKTAVSKGTSKIMMAAQEYSNARLMPFLPKHLQDSRSSSSTDNNDHAEDHHHILHAIEAAEKAVLHAVLEEVETIFHASADELHPLKDDHSKTVKKAKEGVKKAVQKAKQDAEESHQERQRWMETSNAVAIDEYIQSNANSYRFCTRWN